MAQESKDSGIDITGGVESSEYVNYARYGQSHEFQPVQLPDGTEECEQCYGPPSHPIHDTGAGAT